MKQIQHIWKGKRINNDTFTSLLEQLPGEIEQILQDRICIEELLLACHTLSLEIEGGKAADMKEALKADGVANPDETLKSLALFLKRESLEKKLIAELGTTDPFLLRRVNYKDSFYESWSPMGVLVHITAGNSPIVAPMAAVEGLLSGNINIIKVAGNTGSFPLLFLERLGEFFNIGKFLFVLQISSKQKSTLQYIIDQADCVSAWGGEEAIRSIREMTPQGIPVVTWGHKISFAYITPEASSDQVITDLVHSICRNEQQSCSSPQCVLLDTSDPEVMRSFAERLAAGLEEARSRYPLQAPDAAQSAEITTVTNLFDADLYFQEGAIYEPEDHLYRILLSYETIFMPSPLYRTVWLSPLPHGELVKTLRSMRQYLQTAGLACMMNELAPLTDLLYRAGVTRIAPVGTMNVSYTGEPHDGVFALPRFLKRVSFRTALKMGGIVSFEEFENKNSDKHLQSLHNRPLQGKKDYPPVPDNGTRILMKSGGTTGEPVYCSYTEKDYKNYIVNTGAQSLIAAGLDVEKDVTADLLKPGHLYGGMNSFISIFDELKAAHLNIGGLDDYKLVAHYIFKGKANLLLGAPSYIVRLLQENEEAFKEYGRINKILYGGEPMSKGQIEYVEQTFGIKSINSILYGANETGTMGFSCECCEQGVFHLSNNIQQLEIIKMDKDEPVEGDEIGRLIFTGYKRENGRTERYEIGDMGCWIQEDCACGRKYPRFKLLGRYGDVIRIGGTFFNYQRISHILSEELKYGGRLQLIIDNKSQTASMTFCMENIELTCEELIEALLRSGYDSFLKTIPSGLITVNLNIIRPDEFVVNQTSMKLRSVIYS